MDALPDWPEGTVTVLSTGAGAPHAIPVSAVIRRGPRELAFALAPLAGVAGAAARGPALRRHGARRGLAITAHGCACRAELERIAVVRVDVDSIQDHGTRGSRSTPACMALDVDEAAQGDAETRSALGRRHDD